MQHAEHAHCNANAACRSHTTPDSSQLTPLFRQQETALRIPRHSCPKMKAIVLIDQRVIMKTKAAVAWKAGAPSTIDEVDLDGSHAGEEAKEASYPPQ